MHTQHCIASRGLFFSHHLRLEVLLLLLGAEHALEHRDPKDEERKVDNENISM